ncbi:hypothetical protein C0991_006488 [Blastosporella zonata]|nr:hypothetical protein C0991_006488 [Blastosporella zonata]
MAPSATESAPIYQYSTSSQEKVIDNEPADTSKDKDHGFSYATSGHVFGRMGDLFN